MQSPGGGRLREKYAVAEALGKTLGEIKEMPENEFMGWVAFLSMRGRL